VITAAGALCALAAGVAVPAAAKSDLSPLVRFAGALAIVLLLIAIVLRSARIVAWAVGFGAVAYVLERIGHQAVDHRAVFVGVLLLLAAELATWSTDLDARISSDRRLVVRRALTLAALCAAALLTNVVLLATTALAATPGTLLAGVGTTAAVAAVAVVLRLVARTVR
jgi:hypothetical protein